MITQEISTFIKSYTIVLFGWQNSKTEAVSVSYRCITNNLKTVTLNKDRFFPQQSMDCLGSSAHLNRAQLSRFTSFHPGSFKSLQALAGQLGVG